MRAARSRGWTLLASAAAFFCTAATPAAACPGADTPAPDGPAGTPLYAHAASATCLVHAVRAERGLPVPSFDHRLSMAAWMHTIDMTANGFFAHTSPSGTALADRVATTGYAGDDVDWRAGETLGYGTLGLSTPRAIVAAWMASPGHRAVLLNPAYDDLGVMALSGLPVDGQGGATYVAAFGTRVAQAPPRARTARRSCARKRTARKRRQCRARRARAD